MIRFVRESSPSHSPLFQHFIEELDEGPEDRTPIRKSQSDLDNNDGHEQIDNNLTNDSFQLNDLGIMGTYDEVTQLEGIQDAKYVDLPKDYNSLGNSGFGNLQCILYTSGVFKGQALCGYQDPDPCVLFYGTYSQDNKAFGPFNSETEAKSVLLAGCGYEAILISFIGDFAKPYSSDPRYRYQAKIVKGDDGKYYIHTEGPEPDPLACPNFETACGGVWDWHAHF